MNNLSILLFNKNKMKNTTADSPSSPKLSFGIHRPQFSHRMEKAVIMHSVKNSRSIPDGREKVVLVMPQRN